MSLGGLSIRWILAFPVLGFLKSCLHCLGHITWASLPMSSDSFSSGKMIIAHRGHIHSYYGSWKSDSTSGFLSLKQDFQRKIKMRFSNLCLLQRFLFWSGFSDWRRPLDVRFLVRSNIQITMRGEWTRVCWMPGMQQSWIKANSCFLFNF